MAACAAALGAWLGGVPAAALVENAPVESEASGLWELERSGGEVRYTARSLDGDRLTVRCPLGAGSSQVIIEADIDGAPVEMSAARLDFEGEPTNPDSSAHVRAEHPDTPAARKALRQRIILRFLAEFDRTRVTPSQGTPATFETAGPRPNPGDAFAPCRD